MAIAKERMKEVIESQPDDATYEGILRELTFERMVERGLADSREGHVISNKKWSIVFDRGSDVGRVSKA